MTVVGVFLAGISVGMFDFSTFGMDPFQVFTHGLWYMTGIKFGTFYMLLNFVLFIMICICDRKKIGLGTILNVFTVGYIVEFSSYLWRNIFPTPDIFQRSIFLMMAVVIMCLGSSLYFTADLGVSTYDAIALILSEKLRRQFKYCRLGSDVFSSIIGWICGAQVGLGTIITALCMGPLISFFNDKISVPLLERNH